MIYTFQNKPKGIEIDISVLKDGDIVFRKGTSKESKSVIWANKNELYSHVGIVVRFDSIFKVIHCVPDKNSEDTIRADELDEFFSKGNAESGAILRYENNPKCASNASQYAMKKYMERIVFDHDYNLKDTTQMYCTELIWRAYKNAGYDITAESRSIVKGIPLFSGRYIFPIDIHKNKELKIIYQSN